MSGYTRQLSNVGAAVMAVCVSGLFVMAGALLSQAFVIFGPLMLAILCGTVSWKLIAYPFRRKIELPEGMGSLFAGWAVATPLAALVVPGIDATLRWLPWVAASAKPEERPLLIFLGALALVVALATIVVFIRLYVALPADVRWSGELPGKSLPTAILAFSFYFFGTCFVLGGPMGTILGATLLSRTSTVGWQYVAAGLFVAATVPPVLIGLALIRRGFWMREIQDMIESLPRSTIAAAAAGPVELQGRAAHAREAKPGGPILFRGGPIGEETQRIEDFYVEDGTDRVLVRLPPGQVPHPRSTIVLERHSVTVGDFQEFKLEPGDPVYVIGELHRTERGAEIRPWVPPYGRFLATLVQRFLDQNWSFGGGVDLGPVLGLKLSPEVFALTDAGEERLRQVVRRHWTGSIALGFALIAGAIGFLFYNGLLT